MTFCSKCQRDHHVGFVSTRFAGTDGVSLEAEKWARIIDAYGTTAFYFGGEIDRDPDRSYIVAEAHFQHPEIKDIHNRCFGTSLRERTTTQKIQAISKTTSTASSNNSILIC